MRPLKKSSPPQVLETSGADWTAAYVRAGPGQERRRHERWRHPEIKEALRSETNAKCAYCEGIVEDVSFPHVEHIKPKGRFPELAHEWMNLTTACEKCNVAKGDYYDPELELINPYVDDVGGQLQYPGPLVDWRKGDSRAELTVSLLALNRAELVSSRTRRILSVRGMIERWHASSGPLREVLESAIRLDARDGEFTETVMTYLEAHGFPGQEP